MTGDWRKKGPVYFIPLRALVGERIKNLLTVGRCISVTDRMWNITRVIPACAVTGQAAGTVVALAINKHKEISDLNIDNVQNTLKDQGAIIKENLK